MTRDEFEAVIWRTFPRAQVEQVDTIVHAADAYKHRAVLAAALEDFDAARRAGSVPRWDGQPPYEVRREAITEGGAA